MTFVDRIRGRFDRTDIHSKIRERLNYQKKELASIVRDADAIEKYFAKRKLPLPLLYNLCTIGLTPPEQTQQIGKYGEGAFYGFVPPRLKATLELYHMKTVCFFLTAVLTRMNGLAMKWDL